MITDKLSNIGTYAGIPVLKAAIEYITTHDLNALPAGRTDIDGDNLYIMIQDPALKQSEAGRCEAHDRYIDVQIVLQGEEYMGYALRSDLGKVIEASAEGDYTLYEGAFSQILVQAGSFAVFFPQDGHVPCIRTENCAKDHKAVMKVRV